MNRRGFFRSIGLAVVAVTTGLGLANFPKPIELKAKWTIEAARDLEAYHGDAFLATGFVYAPYIPLYVTSEIHMNTEFMKRFNSHRAIPYTADKEAFQRQLDKIWQTVTITA